MSSFVFVLLLTATATAETIFVEAEAFVPSSDGWEVTSHAVAPRVVVAAKIRQVHGGLGVVPFDRAFRRDVKVDLRVGIDGLDRLPRVALDIVVWPEPRRAELILPAAGLTITVVLSEDGGRLHAFKVVD